jgi:hypothetical protein
LMERSRKDIGLWGWYQSQIPLTLTVAPLLYIDMCRSDRAHTILKGGQGFVYCFRLYFAHVQYERWGFNTRMIILNLLNPLCAMWRLRQSRSSSTQFCPLL